MSRRAPAAHWVVMVLGLGVLAVALLLQGLTDRQLGTSSTSPPAATAPSGLPEGSVLFQDDGALQARSLPERTVAITFEDGPDPEWTPQVLDALAREDVPATFFVVGSRVAGGQDLVRRVADEGHELGLHTWTHTDLAEVPAWRRNLELSLGQLGVAGAAGRTSALLRPPYASTPAALDVRDVAAVRQATGAGYLVALADRDSGDWRRPGVERIVAASLPEQQEGVVLLLTDAGGDRSQTVAALPRIVAEYRERGYRFTTVSEGLGLAPGAAQPQAPTLTRWQGSGLLAATAVARAVADGLLLVLVPLGVLAVLRTVVLMALARRHVRVAARRVAAPGDLPPVTVLVPAFDEEVGISATVRSLVGGDHPDVEVIVVDDGSTDRTAEVVEGLGLPGVRLVRQRNAGKAAALTNGLQHATRDVVVMVDGDTVFEPDALRRLVAPLADPAVGAVSGNTKVGNRAGLLGRWQHLEYVVGFNLDRRLYDLLRCMPTVPGAIGAFRREALAQVGGVSSDTLAEDTDLTMAVSRAGWRVVYEERAVAWTEAPATLRALWRQRYRWCYGTLQSVWKHRGAVRDRGQGRWLGLVGLPYLLTFQVLLPLLAPVIDVFALYGLLFLDARSVAAYWLGFLALQAVAATYALRLDGESLRPLWSLPLQQFVYRQLMYLVVIQSVVSAFAGVRLPWHKLERTGLDDDLVPA